MSKRRKYILELEDGMDCSASFYRDVLTLEDGTAIELTNGYEELIKAVNSLLLVLSEDEDDYPDAASYRQVMERMQRVETTINKLDYVSRINLILPSLPHGCYYEGFCLDQLAKGAGRAWTADDIAFLEEVEAWATQQHNNNKPRG